MLAKLALALLASASFSPFIACASVPKAEEIAAADIGTAPELDAAKGLAETIVRERLKDPESAQFGWPERVERGWYRVGFGKPSIGWYFPVAVNARNSFGGYTGRKVWTFFFRHGSLVAYGEPFGDYGSQVVMELKSPIPVPAVSKDSKPTDKATP